MLLARFTELLLLVTSYLKKSLIDPVTHPLIRLRSPLEVRVYCNHFKRFIRGYGIRDYMLEIDTCLRKYAFNTVRNEPPLVVTWGDDGKFHL